MPRPQLQLRRYIAGDAALIRPRPEMSAEAGILSLHSRVTFIPSGEAWTVTQDGAPIACGGLMPIWPARLCAWTWIGERTSMRAWAAISRAADEIIWDRMATAVAHHKHLRIEATAAFPKAREWLSRLGFTPEGVLSAYGPDGADYAMYARTVKP